MKRFARFADFYPVYLAMHSHPVCRRLHVLGNMLALGALAIAIISAQPWALLAMPALASGFAFVGHHFFQKNRPGVLRYPVLGTLGAWVMTKDVLLGKIAW